MKKMDNVYPEDECGICFNPYKVEDNITWFPCSHCVCLKCYLKCTVCPMCRAPFDRNIKPPVFAKIYDLLLQIENEIKNNGDPLHYIERLEKLKKDIL